MAVPSMFFHSFCVSAVNLELFSIALQFAWLAAVLDSENDNE
jgi:hypothetical protein